MDELVRIALGLLGLLGSPSVSIYWVYLATAAALAVAVYWATARRRGTVLGALRFVCSRRTFGHRSSRHDATLLVINTLLHSFCFAVPLQAVSSTVASRTWGALHATLGASGWAPDGWLLGVVATIAIFAAADLGFFVSHVLLHKIPALWELHKVHHSAPVMTPLTVFRRHPGEVLFDGVVSGSVLGVTFGALAWAGGQVVTGHAILGVNACLFVALAIGFNLQHSHVWLRFGPLEAVLISPAAHQLHHSDAPEHFDRNFGNLLCVWDRLLGTYHAPPADRGGLRFGIRGEAERYDSVLRLYVVPIVRILGNTLRRRGTSQP